MYCKIRRAAKKLYYDNQFTKFTNDSKKTWSMLREIIGNKKSKEQIPAYFQHNGKIISDYLEIANGFNNFFANIGPKLASEISTSSANFQTFMPEISSNSFRFSRISEIDILHTCKQMKPKLSSGADFISTKLLKEIAPLIITPLHYLINLSLDTAQQTRRRNNQSKSEFSLKLPSYITFCRPGVTDDCSKLFLVKF